MWDSLAMGDDELVGSDEACRITGIPKTTWHRWVNQGRITPVHVMPGISGAKLFRRADVERLARESAEAAS